MGKDDIKEEDLDFYLTIIYLFCQYNTAEHFSDKMFGDITSDIIKRDRIIETLERDGYIAAKKSVNIPHRYKIDITPVGVEFQSNGGYKKQKRDIIKKKMGITSLYILSNIASAIIGGIIVKIIDRIL